MSSNTFTYFRDTIILDALETVGAVLPGHSPSPEQRSSAVTKLNMLVQELSAPLLWKVTGKTQSCALATAKTGTDGNVYRCIKSHTSSATDEPGVGAYWTTYWIADAGATTTGAWALAQTYTTPADITLATDAIAVDEVRVRYANTDIELLLVGRFDFEAIPDKWEKGQPIAAWVEMATIPIMHLWPQPDNTDYVIHWQETDRLSDLPSSASGLDFPQEYLNPLSDILVGELAPKFISGDGAAQKIGYLRSKANEARLKIAKGMSETTDTVQVEPAYR